MRCNGQVAYHHAGISADDRAAVEKLFQQGQVRVLCSTSTLAVGINTPTYLVIIKGPCVLMLSLLYPLQCPCDLAAGISILLNT